MGTRLVVGFVLVLGCGERTESGTSALQSFPDGERAPRTGTASIGIPVMNTALDFGDRLSVAVDHDCASGTITSVARVLSSAQMTTVSLGSNAIVRGAPGQLVVGPAILELKDAELATQYPTLNSRWDAAKASRGIDGDYE